MLQDIAIRTNGTVISEEVGLTLEQATLDHLGTAKRMTMSKENTTIIDGAGERTISKHALTISARKSKTPLLIHDKKKLQERVAKLAGGVAVIRVGAATEVEMKEKKARVENALHSTRAAVEEGVVPGGGTALVRVMAKVQGLTGDNEDQNHGINMALRAMESLAASDRYQCR